jgi:uncharacterized protein YggE
MKTLCILFLLSVSAAAQTKPMDYLVVRGSAQIQVPVDYLELSVAITSRGTSFRVANDTNRTLTLNMLNTLRAFGIADSDFQTVNNSSMFQDYNREADRKYVVTYSGTLFLRNLSLYDSLFQALLSLGDVSVTVTRFRSNHLPYYRILAYKKAIDAARAEAEMMLKGSHQSVGKIIKLLQDNRDVFTQYDDIDKLVSMSAPPLAGEKTFSTQSEVSASRATFRRRDFTEFAEVTVIFEIK